MRKEALVDLARLCASLSDKSDATFTDAQHQRLAEAEAARIATVLDLIGPSAVGRCLEVGLGLLYVALPLARAHSNLQVVGVEHPDRTYLRDPRYQGLCTEAGIEVVTVDLTVDRLPFADGEFDFVTFSETLEHVPTGAVDSAVADIARVLRPGGTAVVTSPNLLSALGRLRLLLGRSPFDLPIPLDYAGGSFGHVRTYSVAEAVALGERHGLDVEAVTYSNWSTHSRPRWQQALMRLIGRGSLSEDWFLRFRKR
jgi:SAM-dependent methyltransferase